MGRRLNGKSKKTRGERHATQRPAPKVALRSTARYVAILTPMLVVLLGFAAFYPALDAEFVSYDDDRLFVNNTSYRGLDSQHFRWAFSTTFMGHYQPLTWLSSGLDFKISGTEPASYHRNNLILHSLNALLVYFVCMRLLSAALKLGPGAHPVALRLSSAACALLFAVHPLRVESVAWASERRDVLSVLFLLLALLAYLRSVPREAVAVTSRGWFTVSLGLLTLSLLSKAWGMSFVVVVTILDIYPLRRLPPTLSHWWSREHRGIWLQKAPFLALGLAAAATAAFAQRSALGTMRTPQEWGMGNRLVQAVYGLAFYVWKTVAPTSLTPCRELPYNLDPFELQYIAAFLAVAVGAAAVILLCRRVPALAVSAIIYVVILSPVLGFAQSGPQFVADRYSYISCIPWVVVLAGGLFVVWRRLSRGWGAAAGTIVALLVVALFLQTRRQTAVWHDSKSLWGHAIAVGVPSATANLNYGILLRREGRVDEAIAHYRRAVGLRPDSGNAWFALGNALKQNKKDYVGAEGAYRQAATFMTQKHRAYLNLGNMYYNNMKRADDAIDAYRAAVDHVENFRSKMFTPSPYLALGIALRSRGDAEEARQMLNTAQKYRKTRTRAQAQLELLNHVE